MGRYAVPAALALLLGGCATVEESALPRAPRTPLELRQAQSRDFGSADPRLVLKAALNVLQDEGYTIREANAELGLVTGVMEWRSREPSRGLKVLKWVAALPTYGASLLLPSGRTEFSAVEANVNVTPEPAGTRVRISLVWKVTDKGGSVRSARPIEDPLAYEALLARLDKAVYLEREGL
jgi:hypothetical protein